MSHVYYKIVCMGNSTVANLTNGLIGSVVGALFTFLAAVWTIRRTRQTDRSRNAAREEERDEQQRLASLASVLGSIRALESEVRWAPLLKGRASAHLLEASMNFYAVQHRRHPDVAEWVLAQYRHFDSAMHRWRRRWWLVWWNRRHLRLVTQHLGEVSAVLVLWATEKISDEEFAEVARSPAGILKRAGDVDNQAVAA